MSSNFDSLNSIVQSQLATNSISILNKSEESKHTFDALINSSSIFDKNKFINKKIERQLICVMCGSNNNQLGQGDFIKFNISNLNKATIQQINQLLNDKENEEAINTKNLNKNQRSVKFSKFRESVFNKFNQKFGISDTILYELIKIGWTLPSEQKQSDTKQDESDDNIWIHSNCALWSVEIINNPTYSSLVSLEKKCSLCNTFGASLKCSAPSCSEMFHYPCVSVLGCYQDFRTKKILCPNHTNNATVSFGDGACCCLCQSSEKIKEQLFCNSCGLHYHLGCLSSNIQMSALLRTGWQCPDCKTCQICKLSNDENKMFICGNCDKCYHSFCAKSDFNSSRCEKCMKLCYVCNIQFARDNETICNDCFDGKRTSKRSVKELLLASNSSSDLDSKNLDSNHTSNELTKINKPTITTKKKQISKKNSRNSIKRQNSASSQVNSLRRSSKSSGKEVKGDSLKRNADNIYDDNDSRSKDIDEPTIGHIKRDEDDHHAVTVIASFEDSFTLKQDMCLHCGSFGKNDESILIACSQCGQSFHNYCAGVTKICNVAMEKGWRCLDCTVCEGCGKATDEGRLLLCDDCDISYHIYCLDPPLDQVPQGNWKCKWCVRCLKCGTKTPGKKSNWKNNYTECGLCNSLTMCPICNFEYKEQDVLVKCFNCSRWSHCNCKTQITIEEAKAEINSQHYCPECQEERTEYNFKINSKKENQLNSKKFLEEIANLSKRGILDEGTFLTDLGFELIKKIKIKPAPSTRRNRAPKTSTNVESEQKTEKLNDEGSRSSSEEKCDGNNENIGDKGSNNVEIKKQISTTKRQINFGLGGFNPKARSRNKNNTETDVNAENENKTLKRKKKSAYEEMIPVYMQEAFFGANMLASKENDFLEDDKIKYEKQANKDSHKISLDENMLKLVQQNKKGHLELGIEDFLDGDIVSYLFNENKNLMEFNADHDMHSRNRAKDNYDEKIFDEKIYEDIFHQIVSDPPKVSNNVDEYLNLTGNTGHEQVNYETNISSRSQHSDNNLFPHTNNLISQDNSLKSTSDTKSIDDLARQFKESTHKYVQYNQIKPNDQAEQNSQMNAYNMNNNNYICNIQLINDKAQTMSNELQDVSQSKANQNNQKLINSQELVENNGNNANIIYQPMLIDKNRKMTNIINNNNNNNNDKTPFINELNEAGNDPNEFLSFEDHEISNDSPTVSKSSANTSKEDLVKNQKKNLEKYAEDEALGELATQAMSLYSNLTFPNLKNEIKDIGERFKYITKLWRKLDAQIKQVYVNKSRQNRYKKKSDEKTVIGKINNMTKRAKSPTNSDKHSDMDNFSRSATPSVNLDDTNDNSQHMHHFNIIKNTQVQYSEPATPQQIVNVQKDSIKHQINLETVKIENKIVNNNEAPVNLNNLTINQIQNHQFLNIYEKKTFEVDTLLRNSNETSHNFQMNNPYITERPLTIQQENLAPNQDFNDKSKFNMFPNIITLQNNHPTGFPANVIINPVSHTIQPFPNSLPNQINNELNNKNTIQQTIVRTVSSNSDVSSHIDNIINDVAAGFGTIPYSSDFEDESNSSFREFLINQEKVLVNDELRESNFSDISKPSNDKSAKPKKKSNKINNKEDENGKKDIIDQQDHTKQTKKRKQKMTIEALVNQQAEQESPVPKLIKTEPNKNANDIISHNYQPIDDPKKYISQYQPTIITQANKDTMSFINIPSQINNPSEKPNITFICKDDNLKKMLSFSDNNTFLRLNILSKPGELGNEIQHQIKLNPDMNAQNITPSFNITNINPNENPNNNILVNKFLQLDGTFDDIDQPSQSENGITNNNKTSMVNDDKLLTVNEVPVIYVSNKIQNSEAIQGHSIKDILENINKTDIKPINGLETSNLSQKHANDYNTTSINTNKTNLIPVPVETLNSLNESYLQHHNKDIKSNFSIEALTNSGKNQPIHAQKFGGENTLLKALLQTAPKNAVVNPNNDSNQNYSETQPKSNETNNNSAVQNNVQLNNVVLTQITKTNNVSEPVTQIVTQIPSQVSSIVTPISVINNVQMTVSLTEESKPQILKSQEISNQPATNTKKSNAQRKPKTIQNKLMADLKNKILDSSNNQAETLKEIIKSEKDIDGSGRLIEIVSNAQINDVKNNNTRKKKAVKINAQKENTSETMIGRVVNDINALEHLVINQSYPDSTITQINYPEKYHSTIIKSSTITYGDLFRLNNYLLNHLKDKNIISKILSKNEEYLDFLFKKNSSLHMNSNKESKTILANKQNLAEFCNVLIEKPLTSNNIKNKPMIKDSTQRLNDALAYSGLSTDNSGEDLKSSKEKTDPEKQNLKEYLKKNSNIKEINHIDAATDDYSNAFSPIIHLETDHINMNAINIEQMNVEISLTQDNKKLIINNTSATIKSVKLDSNLRIINDTPITIQNLMNTQPIKACKFCDSFLLNDFITDGESFQSIESQQNSVQPIMFCSEFCKDSYKKLAILKKKETSLESKPSMVSLEDSLNQEKKTKKVNEIFKELEEKTIIKWSMDLFNSTKVNEESLAKASNVFEILKSNNYSDKRVCIFCQMVGDQEANGPGRLLTIDLNKWCHLNCALWSDEVYETMNGSLINVDVAFKKSVNIECCFCHHKGASLKCFSAKCNTNYHLPCAIKDKCILNHDKTFFCPLHANKSAVENKLNDLSVHRNVWIQRDEVAQIQSFMSSDFDESYYAIRIGSLILHNIGQLLPHQLNSGNFHNRNYIYPIGYKATRFYWSPNKCFKRCRYICSIYENDNLPEFSITIIEDGFEKVTFADKSPTALWQKILEKIEKLRKDNDLVKLFPVYYCGEYLFGLTEPHIIRLIESLPGVETLTNYVFKYGRLQLLDMPLTINPTGCARSEPKLRTHFRKSHITCNTNQRSSSSSGSTAMGTGSSNSDSNQTNFTAYYGDDDDNEDQEDEYLNLRSSDENQLISYTKQFVFSKSTQFKKLKAEWRSNVYLKKSAIQGLGLYAAKDLEKNTMIIEYIGDLIRNEVANRREKLYEAQNRGIYMFRLNDDFVVDATITGGLARYINHSCEPNCIAETVSLEKDEKIVIIANKRILKGEELTYDYKFDFEDEGNKISCLCGAANCKKWMN